MTLAAEKEYQHMGETAGAADHDHDLVKELAKRLDALWRYDQYIANAEGHDALRSFWTELKGQETRNVKRLKELVADEINRRCF